jgi:uncharacterized ion transporter superfamily protein YfcC
MTVIATVIMVTTSLAAVVANTTAINVAMSNLIKQIKQSMSIVVLFLATWRSLILGATVVRTRSAIKIMKPYPPLNNTAHGHAGR